MTQCVHNGLKYLVVPLLLTAATSLAATQSPTPPNVPQPNIGVPQPGPINSADIPVRRELKVRMPTRLSLTQSSESVTVAVDKTKFETETLRVGENMITGVGWTFRQYEIGSLPTSLIDQPFEGLKVGLDFNLGTQSFPVATFKGKVIEMDFTIFETDIPPQHMWQPRASKNYKVLWRGVLEAQTSQIRSEVADLIQAFDKSHDAAEGRKALESLQYLTLGRSCIGDGEPCAEKKAESVPETTTLWLKMFTALDAAESGLAKKLKTVFQIDNLGDDCGGMFIAASGLSEEGRKKRCDDFLAENERNRLITRQYAEVRKMRDKAGGDFWLWASVYKGNAAARDQIAKEAETLGCTPSRIEKIRAVVDAPDDTFPPHEELTPSVP
jgi:hypothetical protein